MQPPPTHRLPPGRGRFPALRYLGGTAICALLVVHALTKSWPQMLWACHVASLVLALGVLFERPRWIGAGVLFHAGSGIPTYLLGALTSGENSPTSVLVHTVPIFVGLCELWRLGLPRDMLIPAWLLHPLAMVASYYLTEPSLNINLVHEPWPPVAALFPQRWMSWLANAALSLVLLAIAERAIRIWFARRLRKRDLAAARGLAT